MGFLEEIVRETLRSVSAPSYAEGLAPKSTGSRPSLRRAIENDRDRGALVVEFKRVSPGHPEAVLPARTVRQFVRSTEPAKPSGFSCLATIPRFEGSPSDVAELARSTARPVLFKDFIVDSRQLDAAARSGASAILLIARLAAEGHRVEPLPTLATEAHARGLEVVLEFHARAELSRVAGVAADVYGVNTRDLDTLAIDRATADGTLREASELGLRPLLGLSGVEGAADAQRFWNAGVDGILVGSAVARAADPADFLASLRRAPTERKL
jgi:indole-3-glycerol phosphate synthase